MKKNKYVDEWIVFSKKDLDAADFLFNNMYPKPLEIICYHCQQSAEKILKSILVAHDIDIQKTHDLVFLWEECFKILPYISEIKPYCEELSPYAIKLRYPPQIEVSEVDTKKALENAKLVFKLVYKLYD